MGFVEFWEQCEYGTKKERFGALLFEDNKVQFLKDGQLRITGSPSYLFAREQFKDFLREPMGLDLLGMHPEKSYSELVDMTKDLD
jgi:hypothetical protein